MAISSANAAAAPKVRKVETLTSGTSWTVPAGVEFINVKRTGAEASNSHVGYTVNGVNGGATTFTGLADAAGGAYYPNNYASQSPVPPKYGPETREDTLATTPGASITYSIGQSTSGGTGSYAGKNGSITIEYWV